MKEKEEAVSKIVARGHSIEILSVLWSNFALIKQKESVDMLFNVAELDVWKFAKNGFEVSGVYRTDRYIDVKDTEVETLA